MLALGNGIGLPFNRPQGGGGPNLGAFISTWNTGTSTTIVLPLANLTYDGTIDWGDGTSSDLSYANRTHVYPLTGTDYTITITSNTSSITGFRVANTSYRNRLVEISQWGNLDFYSTQMFFNCNNLVITATDAPIITTTSLFKTFDLCTKVTQIGNIDDYDTSSVTAFNLLFTGENSTMLFNQNINSLDFSSATTIKQLLKRCVNYNHPMNNIDVGNVTNFESVFEFASSFDQDISMWNIVSGTNFTNFMSSAGLSTTNYDLLLVGWEATLQASFPAGAGYAPTINIHFGSSTYTTGSAAETARTSLISTFGWTITDGGGV